MPLPKTKDVGKIMHKLKEEDMPHKQKVAIALSTARKAGAKMPMPAHKKKMDKIKEMAKYA